jgi:hypothetical protein
MTLRNTLGFLWGLLGIIGFFYLAYQLVETAMDSEYGITSGFRSVAWYTTQALFPLFCFFAFYAGVMFLKGRRWSIQAIKYLSIIALMYFLAFTLLGAHSEVALHMGCGGIFFFSVSYLIAYREAKYAIAT